MRDPAATVSPLSFLMRWFLVGLFAILSTLFFPGWIAFHDKVFYAEDVEAKLPPLPSLILRSYETKKRLLEQNLDTSMQKLAEVSQPTQKEELEFHKNLIQTREDTLKLIQQPVFPVGFFLSGTMLLWPSLYTSLGCLLVCFRPSAAVFRSARNWRRAAGFGVTIYVFYEWPLWVRNFVLGTHARTVYYFTNYDIDRASFFTQEAIIFGLSVLIAAVWVRWTEFASIIDLSHDSELAKNEPYLNIDVIKRLQRHFYEWLLSSVVLFLGFVYFTSFYWNLVVTYHDARYLLSALIAHTIWALTWSVISIPLVKSWLTVKRRRLNALDRMMKAQHEKPPRKAEQINFDTIDKIETMAGVRLSLAGAGALLSLCIPIIQLFFHKG